MRNAKPAFINDSQVFIQQSIDNLKFPLLFLHSEIIFSSMFYHLKSDTRQGGRSKRIMES